MSTCPKCFLNGCYPCEEFANRTLSDPLLIGCEDASSSALCDDQNLLNYLQRNPNAHVVLIRKQEIGYGFRLRLLQSHNRSSPLLKQIHIKYLSSASELNQFIVASRLSYEYTLLAIDNWGDFFKESTAVVKMSKTLGLLKELGVPSLLLDNQLNSTTLKEYDSFFRSSFSSILHIHIVSPSLYSMVSLSPNRGDDGAVSFRVAEHSIQLQSS